MREAQVIIEFTQDIRPVGCRQSKDVPHVHNSQISGTATCDESCSLMFAPNYQEFMHSEHNVNLPRLIILKAQTALT